ncbi:MAG: hypothetical protein M3277_12365 [Actinomycetota bacterium]|nr:hypothetical protein [Actinomycetota bacterium]
MRKLRITALVAIGLVFGLIGTAFADQTFSPKFTVELTDTKVLGNPDLKFHLEFAREDEEIGNFIGYLPKGFNVAADEAIENGETIGGGEINIAAGPTCHPSSPIQDPRPQIPVSATFEERDRTDDEADAGVHAVWFLNLEPLNRVRLLVTGSPKTGWKIEGAPTPSDGTCNPLVVDLTIDATSESGVKIVTNAKKPGPKKFMADIVSQDSPAIAHFEQIITLTN